jgi:mono/diheme cytochrome c family protein
MNSTLVRAFTVGAVAVGAVAMAHAQQSSSATQGVDLGKWEYDGYCAVCHGATGKGDGVYAEQLEKGTIVANLTELSKKNNGVFPLARVYETIDGRQQVQAHGTRDMPIWGREYSAVNSARSPYPYSDNEAFAREKILALTEYIYRLQAK